MVHTNFDFSALQVTSLYGTDRQMGKRCNVAKGWMHHNIMQIVLVLTQKCWFVIPF